MSQRSGHAPPLRSVVRSIFRHKWKASGFFFLTLAITFAIVVWFPRTYVSEARLFVRLGRETVGLDPTATTGQMISVTESRESEINSVVEILRGRVLAERVVDALGPKTLLDQPGPAAKTTASKSQDASSDGIVSQAIAPLKNVASQGAAWFASLDPLDDREHAIQQVIGSLNVYATKKSNVINVRFSDTSPKRAQQVATALLDAYLTDHMRVNRTKGSKDFFNEQSSLMQARWDEAAAAFRDAKDELGLVSVETQRHLLEEEANRLDEQLVLASTAQAAAEAKVADLKKSLATQPERLLTEREEGHPNEALNEMRNTLYELEIRERELLSKFTEDHPHVQAVKAQVAEAEKVLNSQDKQTARWKTDLNPAHEKLRLDLLGEQAEAAALSAKVTKLSGEIARVKEKFKELNAAEVQLARLQQEVSLAEANYRSYAVNLEQARIDGALQDDQISNVNILQTPSFEPKPASPKKAIVLVMGLAIALLGSAAIVLVSEQMDHSLKSPDDVEEQLDLPVLVSLPRTARHRVLVNNN